MNDFWVFDAVLATPALNNEVKIDVYPNPSSDQITINTWGFSI